MIQGRILHGLILSPRQYLDEGRTGSTCAVGRMTQNWRTALPTKELDYGNPERLNPENLSTALWVLLDGMTLRDLGHLSDARLQVGHHLRPRSRWET